MYLFGTKEVFAIEIIREKELYEMSLYVEDKNILEFSYKNMQCTYRWYMISNIVDWFDKNLLYIINNDEFPFETVGNSAAEFCKNYFEENIDELAYDIDKFEMFQNWTFRHSWFSERAGAYLPEIYFRKQNNDIEVSWDNSKIFKDEDIEFKYEYGHYYIERKLFIEVIEGLIGCYDELKL